MSDLSQGILIVDFGSQTTLLIARRVREMGVYSEVWPCTDERLHTPPSCLGIVLSGGPSSVADIDSPKLATALLDHGVPVLGICYGMQLITEHFGGKVAPTETREYGRNVLTHTDTSLLVGVPENTVVWMSHGDAAVETPAPIRVTGRSESGLPACIDIDGHDIYGVQFHPEVSHTEHGEQILQRFAVEICKGKGTWSLEQLARETIEDIRREVGDGKVLCGLSGGVDSTVAAALIAKAIGPQLVCVCVDNGLMRHKEVAGVEEVFNTEFPDVELRVVHAQEAFLSELAGVTDPETKRKIIGRVFIEVFERESNQIKGVTHLAQGTLYPDVIESVSVRGPSSVIKSHHNVGGLPELLPFKLLEPLRMLFKDEVRALGKILGVPHDFIRRHPFPGPGLAIRILGDITEERLRIVRESDRIFMEMLHEHGIYDDIWQAFAVLLPVKTVGVMGDARTYEFVIALRAVTSRDGMTADRSDIPMDILGKISSRIIGEVRGVNRVTYDLTSKPPATIEWE
jgi:GMP synthase (glutamine-hydrolysing)